MKTQNLRTITFYRVLCVLLGLFIVSMQLRAQSESNNMITYDTIYREPSGARWAVRITRPANMFTPNHPDTASRPAIIMMPGIGEAVDDTNQQKANARKFGPHYWLATGQWDGSVELGNGKHYPILITVVPSYINPRGPAFYGLISHLLNTYHIKRNAVHGTGLSMGAFTWTKSMVYEASAGAETFMKLVTSITALQGASNETFAPYNAWTRGWDAFGHWAKKYNGKFFGLEGTNDSRQVWRISQNMNEHVPGSAYFAFENIGGGAHCCWNDMYSPFRTNWTSVGTLGPNIAVHSGIPNTMGTYKAPANVYQWMLRQGDTTLVGQDAPAPPPPPTVSAGASQTLQLPISLFTLTGTAKANGGNTIQSTTWSKVSGPAATISLPGNLVTTVVGIGVGTYVFKLTAKDNQGQTSEATTTVDVLAETPPEVSAGSDQTITLPTNSVQLTGTVTGSVTSSDWTLVSGPNTPEIVSPANLSTQVNGLVAGTYVFKLSATNSGGTVSSNVTVIVNAAVEAPVADAGTDQTIELPANTAQLTGSVTGTVTTITWSQLSGPNTATITKANELVTDISNLVEGAYVFKLTVENSAGSHSDEVSVIVKAPVVEAPAVEAGSDQEITLPANSVQLTGTVTGELTSSQWSQVSGPNTANIADATNLTTEVTGLMEGVYVFELSATNTGGTTTATVTITVKAPSAPQAPVVHAGADQAVTLPQTSALLNGVVTGTDYDAEWTQINGPNTAVIVNVNSASTEVSNLIEGVYTFVLTATNAGGTNTDTVTITVHPEQVEAPAVDLGSNDNISVTLPTNSVSLSAAISAGIANSILWSQVSGPNTATIEAPEQLDTKISGLVQGVYEFRIIVSNGAGSDTATVTITVNAAAVQAPVVDAGDDQTITLPVNSITLIASVQGTATVTEWTLVSGPGTAAILSPDQSETIVNGLEEGVYVFKFTASNEGGEDTATIVVTVLAEAVAAPVVNAGANQSITLPQNSFQLTGSVLGEINSSTWSQLSGPNTATIENPGDLVTNVTGLVQGVYEFILSVTNDGGTSADTITITVNAEPVQPPVVSVGANKVVTLPTNSVDISGTAQGMVNGTEWSQVSGPNTANIATPNNLTTTVSGLVEGVYVFKLTATNVGGSNSANITITVNAPNTPPVVNAGSNELVTLPANSVEVSGSVQGVVTSTAWSQVSGPSTATIATPNNLTTTINNLVEGVYVFRLSATNAAGTASATITVTVNPAPVENPGSTEAKTIVGLGEYQVYFLDSAKHLWGLGNISNIGTNGQGTAGVPRRVQVSPFDLKFKAVIGGLHGGGAIDEDGYFWVMGDNDQGQHGQGDLTATLLPRKILVDSAGKPFNNLVAGAAYFVKTSTGGHNGFFAIKNDGTLWVWGRTLAGMRGNGTDNIPANTETRRPVQVIIPGNRKVKQIVAGNFAIALCTDGTVWTWGQASAANLGYAATGLDYTRPHQLTGLSNITQIAGSGTFNYALSSNGILYGWGSNGNQMCDPTYPAGNGLSYPTPRPLTHITNKLPLPIKKIVTNTVATHVILEDGSLYGWGLNSEGAVGVGQERAWTNYNPQYAWDFTSTPAELVKTPTPVAPTIKFADVWGSNVYTFYTYAIDVNGQLYCWGRNKASVLAVQTVAPNGTITAARQSAWCRKWPTPVDPFSITKSYVSTSPDCVSGASTGSPCSTYPIPANTRPVANAGTNQTVATNFARLDGTASTDNVFIAYYEWKQVSGPSQALINLPASKTPTVYNLQTGVYKFQLKVTDNGWLSDSAIVTVAVNAAIPTNTPPVANAGADKTITLPVNTVVLTGSGTDANGSVVGYQWTKIAGPAQFAILTPNASQTVINSLVEGVYKFELKVTDDEGAVGRDTVSVTVNAAPPPVNQLPIASAGPDRNITLPANSTTLTGSGSDPDGSITAYQWSYISGPTQYNIASPTQAQTAVSGLVQGVYHFVLRVTDNQGGVARDTVKVTVNAAAPPPNQAPVANAGPDRVISLPTNSITVNGGGTDADGTVASFRWTYISGPAQYNIVSPNAAQTVINNLVQGVYRFELRVTDNQGAIGKDTITVTVNASAPPVNQAPIAYTGPNATITLPVNTVTVNGSASYDPDGSISSYQWTKIGGPSQFTIVSPTQAQTVINNLVQGVYSFELRVTDNQGAIGKDTLLITVNAAQVVNQAPIAFAGSDVVITLPTNTASLNGTASYDPDGSITAYQWTKITGPGSGTIAAATQAQTTVTGLTQGVYTFELRVTDNKGAVAKDTMKITVNAAPVPNQLPVAIAGNDVTISLPTNSVNLNGSASYDPDGSITAYQWTKITGPASGTITAASSTQTSVTNLVQGTYSFELRVTDNKGAIAKDTVVVTVKPVNQPPVANAGNDVTITLPTSSITINGSNSFDPDGTLTAYQWTKISGPAQGTIVSPTQKQTVVNNLVQGVYKFELRVTDNQGATAKDTVTVTVNQGIAPNQAPVAKAGNDFVITLPNNSVTADGRASQDPDGAISSYQWTKISGPAQYTIVSPTAAQTVINNLVQGVYEFELRVTDNQGAIGKDTLKVTVNAAPIPNQLPVARAGNDVAITLPVNGCTVNGSGSYDPDGTIASYQWTRIAGPAQFSISSPNQAQTAITNLVAGLYQFELRVTDNRGGIGKDTVAVLVNPAPSVNKPPVAVAGNRDTITMPVNRIALDGTGSHDPDGQIVSYNWSMVNGPSQAVFTSANAIKTDATELVAGEYTFRLTVTDNSGAKAYAEVIIVVLPEESNAKVYPNPVSDVLNLVIESNTQRNRTDVQIFDARGNQVHHEQFMRDLPKITRQINVSTLAKGIYFIKVQVDINHSKTIQFMKQ